MTSIRPHRPRRHWWRIAAAFVVAPALAASVARAEAPHSECAPPEGIDRLAYDIYWADDPIGTLSIDFEHADRGLVTRNRATLQLKITVFELLRFTHESEERWTDGQLRDYRGTSVVNDETFDVRVTPQGDRVLVSGRDGDYETGPETPLISAWCSRTLRGPRLIKASDGSLVETAPEVSAPETVDVRGRSFDARRFALNGDLDGAVWFDARDVVVYARFPLLIGGWATLELLPDGGESAFRLRD